MGGPGWEKGRTWAAASEGAHKEAFNALRSKENRPRGAQKRVSDSHHRRGEVWAKKVRLRGNHEKKIVEKGWANSGQVHPQKNSTSATSLWGQKSEGGG